MFRDQDAFVSHDALIYFHISVTITVSPESQESNTPTPCQSISVPLFKEESFALWSSTNGSYTPSLPESASYSGSLSRVRGLASPCCLLHNLLKAILHRFMHSDRSIPAQTSADNPHFGWVGFNSNITWGKLSAGPTTNRRVGRPSEGWAPLLGGFPNNFDP